MWGVWVCVWGGVEDKTMSTQTQRKLLPTEFLM